MSTGVRKLVELIITVVAVTFSTLPTASAQEIATPPDAARTAAVVTPWNVMALRASVTEKYIVNKAAGQPAGEAAADAIAAAVGPTAVTPAASSTSPTCPAPVALPNPDASPHWCRRWLPCAR